MVRLIKNISKLIKLLKFNFKFRIGVISGSLSTMLLTAAMIFTCSFSCEDLMKYKSFRDMLKELSVEDCPTLRFCKIYCVFEA